MMETENVQWFHAVILQILTCAACHMKLCDFRMLACVCVSMFCLTVICKLMALSVVLLSEASGWTCLCMLVMRQWIFSR